MNDAAKLLWEEGLFLRPQHFQRQDAYHESHLHQIAQALHPYAWGLRSARFDRESLANGVLRMTELSVIFPDGVVYAAPDSDELPSPLALRDLPEGIDALVVHLALPDVKTRGGNAATLDADAAARYRRVTSSTPDLYSEADDADVTYLVPRPRLLTDAEARDAFATVPLVRFTRSSTGGFDPDPRFLPPAVGLRACPALLGALRALLDALQAKAEALVGLHREPSPHVIEFRSGDVASFWLLHTVNAASAALAHLYQNPDFAPERLHQELSRLAGSLLTFAPAHRLADLPRYDHRDPRSGFWPLFDMIHALIDTVISTQSIAIALTQPKPSYHLGHLDSPRIDQKSSFYLAVRAGLPAAELIGLVPLQFKVGAPDDVQSAVLAALPGIALSHQPQVPAAVPVRPGAAYFLIEARGALYDRMLKAKSIMIYAPSGVPELALELVAVLA
ncbi:MAG TPA: type VI secretion system baseplate subunit TssK [Nevskiaceae bacterium]